MRVVGGSVCQPGQPVAASGRVVRFGGGDPRCLPAAPTWPGIPDAPTTCTPTSCVVGLPGMRPTPGSTDRDPTSPRRALYPPAGRVRASGLLDPHDDARRARVLPVRPHRRRRLFRPSGLCPPSEDSRGRVPRPGPGPTRTDPLPPGRAVAERTGRASAAGSPTSVTGTNRPRHPSLPCHVRVATQCLFEHSHCVDIRIGSDRIAVHERHQQWSEDIHLDISN